MTFSDWEQDIAELKTTVEQIQGDIWTLARSLEIIAVNSGNEITAKVIRSNILDNYEPLEET